MMKILWVLSLFALTSRLMVAEAQTNTTVDTPIACDPRLRKDWEMMTLTEKATYKGALVAAMDSGDYIKFVEMHTEMMSELEAHRQCMFVYWHRLFLVVFENMLRGQGPQYACVTVPYSNWVAASSRVTTGTCTSFGNCFNITKELGGFTSGVQRTLSINGISNSGRCCNAEPINHFCQRSFYTGSTSCANCVPRSDWTKAKVPAVVGYASVRQQVFSGKNIGQMSPLVEKGCHNNVHANLGATMGTFAAPADPIFWSHHAMVDLLHVIFHQCRVPQRLTFEQKASNPVAWTSCARRNGGVFNPTDSITMRTGEFGVNPINGMNDSKIGQFFAGVPNQYAGLMDVRDLGSSSYGYSVSGQVATLYTMCDASPTWRGLEETIQATTTTSKCDVAHDGENDGDNASRSNTHGGNPQTDNGGDYISPEGLHVDGNDLPDDVDGYQQISQHTDGHVAVVITDSPTATESDDSEQRVVDWYQQTITEMGGDTHENMADLERQACMFENQCLGGTDDYSPEFKAIWNVTEPRCKTIVDAINNGSEPIIYEAWREKMEARFGCPQPANSTIANSTYPIDTNATTYPTSAVTREANDTIQVSDL